MMKECEYAGCAGLSLAALGALLLQTSVLKALKPARGFEGDAKGRGTAWVMIARGSFND